MTMRNIYIKPCASFIAIENSTILAESTDPEPEMSGEVGSKQSSSIFEDVEPSRSLWDDDEPTEDSPSTGQ